MTTKRFLLGAVAAACVAGAGRAADPVLPTNPFGPIQDAGVIPVRADVPPVMPPPAAKPVAPPAGKSGMLPPPPLQDKPGAADVLTASLGPMAHPAGTVCSPGYDGTCCGPVGGSGPITYELIAQTGPSLPIAGGSFSGRLNVGWGVGGGVRTLWFNPEGSAANVLELGVNYIYNSGQQADGLQVFTPQARDASGNLTGPDLLAVHGVRGLHRTSFNFALGKDWFFGGPAYLTPDGCGKINYRVGGVVGGRWGTSHVDLVPIDDPGNYLRRTGITQSVFLGVHADRTVELGGWAFITGLRTEWDYTWTNVIPDHNGDVVSINLWMYAGVRY